jgi:hypothetical protein
MDGEKYPRRGNRGICLDTILCECDASEMSDVIRESLLGNAGHYALRCGALEDGIREIATRYLTDSQWHDLMESEMIEEERDE